MYPTNLIESLIELLVKPDSSIINVGSSEPISMVRLAESIRDYFGRGEIEFLGKQSLPSNYVPETSWLQDKFEKNNQTKLHEGLQRWDKWLTAHPNF